MTADPCASCPFAAGLCGCRWRGGDVAQAVTFARYGDNSGSVGTDTSGDLLGAQIGADVIEGEK